MAFFTITVTSPIKESEKLPYPYNWQLKLYFHLF
jgi:hypothetical protein